MKTAFVFALVFAGMIGHFLKKLYDLEQSGTILWPLDYWRMHPYGVLSSIAGAYLLALVAHFAGQLNEIAAILIGFSCSSAMDTLRARAAGRMKDYENDPPA